MSIDIRFLHISDFHINRSFFSEGSFLVNPLLERITEFNKDKSIDVVVYTGDLIHKGGSGFDTPEGAFESFKDNIMTKIENSIGVSRDRFVICPGNHDMVHRDVEEHEEIGLKETLTTKDNVNDYIISEGEIGDNVKRVSAFNRFERNIYGDEKNVDIGPLDTNYNLEIRGFSIGVSSLNSTWRYFHGFEEKGEMILSTRQVQHAVESIGDNDINVACTHYPLEWIKSFERDDIKSYLFKHYDLLLTGHIHEDDTSLESRVIGGLFRSTCPGVLTRNLNSKENYENGFNVIDLDIHERKIIQHSQVFSDEKLEFVKDTHTTQSDGRSVFDLPTDSDAKAIEVRRDLAETVRDVRYEQLNEDLVTYGTDTDAPQELLDLFVMPPVVHRTRDEDDDVSSEKLTLKELRESDKSYLLIGEKETGKTTLLERLFVEINENTSLTNEVPVLIDINELGNRGIITKIKDFFHINTSKAEYICNNSSIVLLIDDIDFSESYDIELSNILEFKENYDDVRIIATTDKKHKGDIAIDRYDAEKLSDFNIVPLEIQKFKVDQIKGLIHRWFGEEYVKEKSGKIDDLVKLFGSLDIPRTPLSVSIFLWIFEKQEEYRPTNKSTMVENFVEKLFDKHSPSEALSAKFDYKNKQRLLANIAKYMEENGGNSYRVKYADLCSFAEKYFEKRKFKYPADKILDGFTDVGILKRDGKYIRFKFTCFFEYYIMKKMQFDEEYREQVLRPDNFLRYVNEIDFLTGIERDRDEILEELVHRLDAAFKPIRKSLQEGDEGVDSFFDSGTTQLHSMSQEDLVTSVSKLERPSPDEIEEKQDQLLDMAERRRSEQIKQKQDPEDRLEKLDRLLMLTARVLKNTEETERSGLKKTAYTRVVDNLSAYSVLYVENMRRMIDEEELPFETEEFIDACKTIYPLLIQIGFLQHVGTQKLTVVIEEEIERIIDDNDVSDFKKFIDVFTYADIMPGGFSDIVKKLSDNSSHNYIQFNTDLKLKSYLHLRANSRSEENKYVHLIAHNYCRSRDIDLSEKGEIIQDIREKRRRERLSGDKEKQQKLPI